MATLTASQLSDFQGDIGIDDSESVFTDDELNRLYTRASGDYELAVYYAYRQLLAKATKFFEYTAGMTKYKRQQVWEHLKTSMDLWEEEARGSGNQVRIVGLRTVPPKYKGAPADVRTRMTDGWYDSDEERDYSGSQY